MQSFKVHLKFLSFDEINKWDQEIKGSINFKSSSILKWFIQNKNILILSTGHHMRDKGVDKTKLSELVKMGYDMEDAEKALKVCIHQCAKKSFKFSGLRQRLAWCYMSPIQADVKEMGAEWAECQTRRWKC